MQCRFAKKFVTACKDLNVEVTVEVSYSAQLKYPSGIRAVRTALERLVASRVKVILLAAAGAPASAFIRFANAHGLTRSGYTWLAPDGWSGVSDLLDRRSDEKNDEKSIAELVSGSLAMFPFVDSRQMNNMTELAFQKVVHDDAWVESAKALDGAAELTNAGCPGSFKCNNKTDGTKHPFNNWAYYSFDSALAVALAAVAAGPRCRSDGECLNQKIRSTTFRGSTGRIRLNGTTGDRIPNPDGTGSFGEEPYAAARCF